MNQRKFTKLETYTVITGSLGSIAICILFGVSLLFGFVGGIMLTSFIIIRKGITINNLINMIRKSIKECISLYILILLIGATISIWLSSGVVPAMIYYGFEYLKDINFLLASFIITSIISLFMGTAVGTISTIGVALLGIGTGFGMPRGILLGVIVSGAFIADKISPISGLLNLTLTTTKTRYRQVIGLMLRTLIPAYIVTALIYYLMGSKYTSNIDISLINTYQQAISQSFNISPYLLILPLGVLVMTVFGIKTIPAILFGLIGGSILSLTIQKMTIWETGYSIIFGYNIHSNSNILSKILVSGGVISMIEVVFIVLGAIILSGILDESGIIKPIINKVISNITTVSRLILKTGLISSILTIITCDQTVGIILPSKVFIDRYDELKVDKSILARTISDTGTIIAPLFPWNVNALIIGTVTTTTAISYAPYAVLCYISPIITILAVYFSKKDKHFFNKLKMSE